MALFPAYSQDTHDDFMKSDNDDMELGEDLSPGAESQLLLDPAPPPPRAAAPCPAPPPAAEDFYLDRKLDRGNLRVSTLYYPARPEYRARNAAALGVRLKGRVRRDEARGRRYWRKGGAGGAAGEAEDAAEATERVAAFRRALLDTPQDEQLWLQYIDFLEWCCPTSAGGGVGGALEAARGAFELLPRAAALRSRLMAAMRRALPPAELARATAHMREGELRGAVRAELWAREISALACAGLLDDARDAAAAAAKDRAAMPHYHIVLLVYGCMLRSAGLWEQLVQLVELQCALHFPPSAHFPPSRDAGGEAAADAQLEDYEDRVMRSGLPLGVVWARVERARGALHWRPGGAGADPQRAPPAAALGDLLQPAAGGLRLLAALLRATGAPLLPAAGYVFRALDGGAGCGEVSSDWECAGGEALLSLLRAARRLPPAHPARPPPPPAPALRRLLQCTPLRDAPADTSKDSTGFGRWQRALWSAALAWAGGAGGPSPPLLALLCWRIRVLHAQLIVADTQEEIRALRNEARDLLRAHAGDSALPYAVFARLEGAAGGAARGARAARGAARGALARAAGGGGADAHEALYAARVVWELSAESGDAHAGAWALACAATRRPLPTDQQLAAPPPALLLEEATMQCERMCDELERQYAVEDEGEEDVTWALLPSAAEWGAARILLAPPSGAPQTAQYTSPAGARYLEQCACAWLARGGPRARGAARGHAHRHPLNARLALVSADLSPWQGASCEGDRSLALTALAPSSELRAWAALVPPLLHTSAAATESYVLYGAVGRALRGAGAAGGALLHALRLAAAPAPPAALPPALTQAAHCKWLLVRAASLGASDPHTLAELALERALRLHALPDELTPLVPLAPLAQEQKQRERDDTQPDKTE